MQEIEVTTINEGSEVTSSASEMEDDNGDHDDDVVMVLPAAAVPVLSEKDGETVAPRLRALVGKLRHLRLQRVTVTKRGEREDDDADTTRDRDRDRGRESERESGGIVVVLSQSGRTPDDVTELSTLIRLLLEDLLLLLPLPLILEQSPPPSGSGPSSAPKMPSPHSLCNLASLFEDPDAEDLRPLLFLFIEPALFADFLASTTDPGNRVRKALVSHLLHTRSVTPNHDHYSAYLSPEEFAEVLFQWVVAPQEGVAAGGQTPQTTLPTFGPSLVILLDRLGEEGVNLKYAAPRLRILLDASLSNAVPSTLHVELRDHLSPNVYPFLATSHLLALYESLPPKDVSSCRALWDHVVKEHVFELFWMSCPTAARPEALQISMAHDKVLGSHSLVAGLYHNFWNLCSRLETSFSLELLLAHPPSLPRLSSLRGPHPLVRLLKTGQDPFLTLLNLMRLPSSSDQPLGLLWNLLLCLSFSGARAELLLVRSILVNFNSSSHNTEAESSLTSRGRLFSFLNEALGVRHLSLIEWLSGHSLEGEDSKGKKILLDILLEKLLLNVRAEVPTDIEEELALLDSTLFSQVPNLRPPNRMAVARLEALCGSPEGRNRVFVLLGTRRVLIARLLSYAEQSLADEVWEGGGGRFPASVVRLLGPHLSLFGEFSPKPLTLEPWPLSVSLLPLWAYFSIYCAAEGPDLMEEVLQALKSGAKEGNLATRLLNIAAYLGSKPVFSQTDPRLTLLCDTLRTIFPVSEKEDPVSLLSDTVFAILWKMACLGATGDKTGPKELVFSQLLAWSGGGDDVFHPFVHGPAHLFRVVAPTYRLRSDATHPRNDYHSSLIFLGDTVGKVEAPLGRPPSMRVLATFSQTLRKWAEAGASFTDNFSGALDLPPSDIPLLQMCVKAVSAEGGVGGGGQPSPIAGILNILGYLFSLPRYPPVQPFVNEVARVIEDDPAGSFTKELAKDDSETMAKIEGLVEFICSSLQTSSPVGRCEKNVNSVLRLLGALSYLQGPLQTIVVQHATAILCGKQPPSFATCFRESCSIFPLPQNSSHTAQSKFRVMRPLVSRLLLMGRRNGLGWGSSSFTR